MIHAVIAVLLALVLLNAAYGVVYGIGRLRHGKQGMEERETQHILRSYGSDKNDPTGGWADF
jgi:hypothetical protein